MGKVFSDIVSVFRRNGNLATQLIIINLVVFFGFTLVKFGIGLFPEATITPDNLSQNLWVSSRFMELIKHPWTLISYPFTHEGLFPLIFDLIIIYWFGNMLADFIGGRKMVITYLSGAWFSIAFFMLVWGVFTLMNKELGFNGFLYGASAGGFALMYAYVALNPESEIMFFTFRIKTRWLILTLLVISIFRSPPLGVVDLGGALFGYLQMKLLRSGINVTYAFEQFAIWLGNLSKPKRPPLQKYQRKQPAGKILKFSDYNKEVHPSQDEIDFLLDKISKGGYESLSSEEKNRLHKASQSAD